MKKHLLKPLFIFLLGFFICSCSSEDNLVNEYYANYSFIFSCAANSLQKINNSSEIIVNIKPDNLTFDSISIIKKFRNHYYLLEPKNKKVIVLEEQTFKLIDEIDYSILNLEPTDICFPNATDAYVTHSNDSCITILDLTNNQISGINIKVDGNPVKIAGVGNQVHVTIPNSNQVAIIDTRTNKVEATINISDAPTYIGFTEDGLKSIVVSVGNGKTTDDIDAMKSPAKITVIDVIKKNIISEFQLGNNYDASLYIKPTSITVSARFVYISSINLANTNNNTIWRIPTTTFKSAINISKTNSNFIGYSKAKDVVYFIENNETKQLALLDGTSNSRIKLLNLPNIPTAISIE